MSRNSPQSIVHGPQRLTQYRQSISPFLHFFNIKKTDIQQSKNHWHIGKLTHWQIPIVNCPLSIVHFFIGTLKNWHIGTFLTTEYKECCTEYHRVKFKLAHWHIGILGILTNYRITTLFFLITNCQLSIVNCQLLTPLSHQSIRQAEYGMIANDSNTFTVLKPFVQNQSSNLQILKSSNPQITASSSWLHRKLFRESFLQIDSSDFSLFADPVFDFTLGQDNTGRRIFTNTRGFNAGGRLGKSFAFETTFYENQAIFPTYIHNTVSITKIVSGQGFGRLNGKTWDYAHASGYLSFTPVKPLNILLGQGKNFVGDGYRSLLLSDVAYNYPYARATFMGKKVMYSWMMGMIQDLSTPKKIDKYAYPKRIITSHLLALELGKHLQLSVIKNTVYNNPDTTGRFSMSVAEFNPLILPIHTKNSHSVWGINARMQMFRNVWIYGQTMFDNLFTNETLRYGFQIGFKHFNAFGLSGLYVQTEFNTIDPRAYASGASPLHWMHYKEPLAHPFGNNLKEGIVIIEYSWKRWQLESFTNIIRSKTNIQPETVNNYSMPHLAGGSKVVHNTTQLKWYLNPKTTAHFTLGYIIRHETLKTSNFKTNYLYFAFRTELFNNYLNLN